MKKITLILLFVFGFSNAQFFESQTEEPAESTFFNDYHNDVPPPEQGTDARDDDNPTNPGELPINNWQFLLTLAGVGVGVWFLRKRYKAV